VIVDDDLSMAGYLLDSDWVVDYLNGRLEPPDLFRRLTAAERLCISVVTYGEVLEGVLYSRRPARDRPAFDELVRLVDVLPVDVAVGERFAVLRGQLRRTGQPLDNFDLLIAATALCHDLILLTRNVAHFERVAGLVLNRLPSPEPGDGV
jgi:predicted nucleic acid-binding protein